MNLTANYMLLVVINKEYLVLLTEYFCKYVHKIEEYK